MSKLDPKASLLNTVIWLQTAFPIPTSKNISTQMGVHFEEFAEMLDEITIDHKDPDYREICDQLATVIAHVKELADLAKRTGAFKVAQEDRVAYLDALCDQIVTATACAHMSDMDVIGAMNEVNRANFSKFDENGKPLFNENLKLIKGKGYTAPQLELFANG